MTAVPYFKKHDQFAAKHNFAPATRIIWRHMRRMYPEGDRHLINLLDINLDIKSVWGKKYDRKTLRTAIDQLEASGLLEFIGSQDIFRVHIKEVHFYSINDLEKKIPEPESSQDKGLDQANQIVQSPKRSIKQQQLIEVKQICLANGINYREDRVWWEIASHGVEKVRATIELLKIRALTSKIPNPLGWFRTALRRNFYLDYDPQSPEMFASLAEKFLFLQDKLAEFGAGIPIRSEGQILMVEP